MTAAEREAMYARFDAQPVATQLRFAAYVSGKFPEILQAWLDGQEPDR